jgi:hypothetical protein
LEGVIRSRVIPRTALRIRQFLANNQREAPFVVSTILKSNAWAESIQVEEPELVSQDVAASMPACDLIQQIAENLIDYAIGIERELLLKSLQEALFCCLGFDTNLTSLQIKTRLKRFLDRHTKAAFIRRFLSLYFFNLIWLHTGEWLSDESVTSKMLEKDIDELDRICKRAVVWAYKQVDVLNESAAEELIRNIEQRLASCCNAVLDNSVHVPLVCPTGFAQTRIASEEPLRLGEADARQPAG